MRKLAPPPLYTTFLSKKITYHENTPGGISALGRRKKNLRTNRAFMVTCEPRLENRQVLFTFTHITTRSEHTCDVHARAPVARIEHTCDMRASAAIVGGRTGTAVVSLVGVHVRRHTPPHGQPLCVRPRGLGLARRCAFPPSSHATAPDTARRYASPHTRPHSNAAPSTLPLYAHTTCNILRDYPTIIENQRPWRCTTKPT